MEAARWRTANGGRQTAPLSRSQQKSFLHAYANLLGKRTKQTLLGYVVRWVEDLEEPPTPPIVLAHASTETISIDLDRLPPELLLLLYNIARARVEELDRPATGA